MDLFHVKLELYFSSCDNPELVKTIFQNPKLGKKIVGQRSIGILPPGTVSFKWTPCSKALALFFVKAKNILAKGDESIPILEGQALSPAATLGTRLWKKDSAWIHDVFGSDKDGNPFLRQLLIGINVRRKTKSPIQLFLKSSVLPIDRVKIFIEDIDVSEDLFVLSILSKKLTEQWSPGFSKKADDNEFTGKQLAA
ncbi:MAG TPA: hypothetical protein PKA63_12595 [Oligoflexia bacterium]|nr:hypothetical protein [Oligoflexia bacterium]